MAVEARQPAVRAFDALASDYDRLTAGQLFHAQRALAHAALGEWLPARSRVLEIGCGTGVDAVFLAKAGMDVVACDPAAEMQRLTWGRASRAGVANRVRVLDCGVETLADVLDTLGLPGFDAIVSNFGALNCAERLDGLGAVATRYLRPGGSALLCVMGRSCLWEIAYFAVTGRLALARRRRGRVLLPVAGVDVPTYYHGVADLGRALGPGCSLADVRGLGVLVPPPYLEARWHQVPGTLRGAIAGVDRLIATWPGVSRCGDHVLTRWVKRRYSRA